MKIKVGYSDQLFYLREPRFLRLKVVLKQKLDLESLKCAVKDTLDLFDEFKIKVSVIDGELWKESNDKEVVFCPYDSPLKYIGSTDTAGYPFFFKYDDNSFELSMNHAMTDFVGMWNFLKTIICKYSKNIGYDFEDLSYVPYDVSDEIKHNPYGVYAQRNDSQYFLKDGPAFSLPQEGYLLKENKQHAYAVNVELSKVLKLHKEIGCSTICMLAFIIAKSIYQAYGCPDENFNFLIPVDMRSAYKINTNANFSESTLFQVTKSDFEGDFAQVCNRLSKDIKNQFNTENFNNHLANNINLSSNLCIKNGLKPHEHTFAPKKEVQNPKTFGFTYPGSMYLSKEYEQVVSDVDVDAYVPLNPVKFTAKSYGNVLTIFCVQTFDEDYLAKALQSEIEKLNIEAELVDKGYLYPDGLDLNRLK